MASDNFTFSPIPKDGRSPAVRLLWSHAARTVRGISLAWALLYRLELCLRRPSLRRAALVAVRAAVAASLLSPLVTYAGSTTPNGNEFRVNTFTTGRQVFPSIAMDTNGDYVITWQSDDQDGSGLGVYAQSYNAAGTPFGSEFRVNTYTTNGQGSPSIAMDTDGDFIIAWQSDGQEGNGYEVYAQRYAAGGTPLGSEFRVNTYTTNPQATPSIGMDADGDFVIAWNSFAQDGDSFGVYAQRYNAAGTPLGTEFRVNTFTTGHQFRSNIAMDANGDFIITWASFQGGSDLRAYAQRYNAAGTPLGNEFMVNTFTAKGQGGSSVDMDADGDFVIAWQSYAPNGLDGEVYAQHYNAAGTPLGNEFRVNTVTSSQQRLASVAMDTDGDFIIVWESLVQDGSNYGIYARYYSATGMTFSNEFRINTYTSGDQRLPHVASDADGNFVVSWQSLGQDGSSYGIYAQHYTFIPQYDVYLPLIMK